jgi:hypothetical protein
MYSNQQKQVEQLLKGLVGNHQWRNLVDYLNGLQEQQYRVLEQSDKVQDIHRAQGFIDALKKIKNLEFQIQQR